MFRCHKSIPPLPPVLRVYRRVLEQTAKLLGVILSRSAMAQRNLITGGMSVRLSVRHTHTLELCLN